MEKVPESVGFCNGHGKKIEVNPTDLMSKGQALFKDLDEVDFGLNGFQESRRNGLDSRNNFGNIGFSTGNGKKIEANPTDLMSKGQALFKDLDKVDFGLNGFEKARRKDMDPPKDFGNIGFSTGNGNKIETKITDLMAKGQAFFKDLDKDDLGLSLGGFEKAKKNHLDSSVAIGFSTGNGNMIGTKMADLMAKGHALFRDLDGDDFGLDQLQKAKNRTSVYSGSESQSKPSAIGFQTAKKTPCDIPAVSKIVDAFETTPKLPSDSKFPIGRRRLAATTSSPVASSTKKRRLGAYSSRIDAMNDQPSANVGLKLFSSSPPLLSSLPTSQLSCLYSSQNGKKTTPSAAASSEFFSRRSARDEIDDDLLLSVDTDIVNSQPRKVELGKLYTRRRDAAERATLASVLAGQVPRRYDWDDYERYKVKKPTLAVNSQNAGTFSFSKEYFPNDLSDCSGGRQLTLGDGVKVTCDDTGAVSSEEFIRAFVTSPLVDPKLVSHDWCLNHYRWIVWKEASMEAGFPHLLGGKLLTPDRVMLQLKYRYDRELEKAERSCLKRILNGDDSTYRPMVLCVSAILVKQDCDALIELTDGWYSLKARLDSPLSQRLARDQLLVGEKLFISRCSLIGLEGGCEPLEIPASAQLVLTANCVRRARWNTTLGFQRSKAVPTFSLSSLAIGGGTVAGVEVLVQRVHPMLYMVKNASGHTLVMDEKAEMKDARVFQDYYDRCLEKIVEEIEKSLLVETNDSGESNNKMDNGGRNQVPRTQEIRSICDIEELYRIISNAADPDMIADRATPTQQARLKAFCAKVSEQQASELHDRFEKAIREKAALLPQRRVTPFLKMRVTGCHPRDAGKNVAPLLTIWRPDDDALYHVKEGVSYVVTNVQVVQSTAPGDSCKFSLSTTAETRFIQLQKKELGVIPFCK